MKVLVFTQMYPSANRPHDGIFVFDEVSALKEFVRDISVLHFDTRQSKLNYFKALPLLIKANRSLRPDIVHCHHTFCVFIARMAGIKNIILTFHEGEFTCSDSYFTLVIREGIGKSMVLSKTFKRFCLRRARHVFDVTGALKDWNNVTSPFHPGVNEDVFLPGDRQDARHRLNLDPKKKYVLFPARPDDKCKRYDVACDILRIVRSIISSPVEMLSLNNIPHSTVPTFMNASDALLLVSDYEASPMVIKEAAACGLPCICYDVGDAAKVLAGIPGSFVIKPDQRRAAELIKKTLEAPVHDRQSFLAEEYNSKNVAKQIYAVYKRILADSQS